MAEAEARAAARRELGNLALLSESTRAAWGWTRLEQFVQDSAYGLRQLQRSPAFSIIAIGHYMALGIGGVTATFGAADAVLVRPLPYCRGGSSSDDLGKTTSVRASQTTLHHLPNGWSGGGSRRCLLTSPLHNLADATISGDAEPEQVPKLRKATANLWSVLGVKPLLIEPRVQ